jgi:translation initiation factor 3 subunit A
MSHASLMGRAAPMERTDSNDRPLDRPSGPPRLNLAGGKPSRREWEAAKGAAGDSASGSSPTGPSSFRVPSSSGALLSRGRSRRGEEDGRDRSPTPARASGDSKPSRAAGKFVPPYLRNK